ncbi:MAG: hypothetical protein LUD52_06065, partial [Opitutae bacterium]|nr:hypothetical protein [Opitutae bacterium]
MKRDNAEFSKRFYTLAAISRENFPRFVAAGWWWEEFVVRFFRRGWWWGAESGDVQRTHSLTANAV